MFCRNCGNQVPDGALFCGNCGTKVEAQAAPQQPAYDMPQQPAYDAPQQPAYTAPQESVFTAPQQPVYVAPQQPASKNTDPRVVELANSILSKGITGLALGALGIPGIIVSNIAMKQTEEFINLTGELYGKAKVGRRLAKPGLILGIVMTAFYVLYAIILMASL